MQHKKLYIKLSDCSLNELASRIRKGRIVTNPEYQRHYVYTEIQASKLIESVLMNIPIPTVYLCEEDDETCSIIDGQQRLVSFYKFLENKLALKGMTVFPQLNGKKYQDLSSRDQQAIDEYSLRTITITQESAEMKYDIFQRLNQGAVRLNAQELRNCIYRGSFNRLLKELAESPKIAKLFKQQNTRMNYEENILRFFALENYHAYRGSMLKIENEFMDAHKDAPEAEIKKMRTKFTLMIDNVLAVLGDGAFCQYDRKNGVFLKKFSGPVYDSIAIAFACFDRQKLISNADRIREVILDIEKNDEEYHDYCYAATGSRERVIGRIEKIVRAIEGITGNDGYKEERRFFDQKVKEALWASSHICSLCGQQILTYEDAEIDHIVSSKRGGPTTIDNAQLAHKYCNASKGEGLHRGDVLIVGDGAYYYTFWEMLFQKLQNEGGLTTKQKFTPNTSHVYSLSTGVQDNEFEILLSNTPANQIRVSWLVKKDAPVIEGIKKNLGTIEKDFGEPLRIEVSGADICRLSYYIDDFELYRSVDYSEQIEVIIDIMRRLKTAVTNNVAHRKAGEISTHSESIHLTNKPKIIIDIYQSIKAECLTLGEQTINPHKFYISFDRDGKAYVHFHFWQDRIEIDIRVKDGKLKDPKGLAVASKDSCWTHCVVVRDLDDIDYIVNTLIRQSFDDACD